MTSTPDEPVELEAVDEPGPPETAPHPLDLDADEYGRGMAERESELVGVDTAKSDDTYVMATPGVSTPRADA